MPLRHDQLVCYVAVCLEKYQHKGFSNGKILDLMMSDSLQAQSSSADAEVSQVTRPPRMCPVPHGHAGDHVREHVLHRIHRGTITRTTLWYLYCRATLRELSRPQEALISQICWLEALVDAHKPSRVELSPLCLHCTRWSGTTDVEDTHLRLADFLQHCIHLADVVRLRRKHTAKVQLSLLRRKRPAAAGQGEPHGLHL